MQNVIEFYNSWAQKTTLQNSCTYSVFILKPARLNNPKATGNTEKRRGTQLLFEGGHFFTAME